MSLDFADLVFTGREFGFVLGTKDSPVRDSNNDEAFEGTGYQGKKRGAQEHARSILPEVCALTFSLGISCIEAILLAPKDIGGNCCVLAGACAGEYMEFVKFLLLLDKLLLNSRTLDLTCLPARVAGRWINGGSHFTKTC